MEKEIFSGQDSLLIIQQMINTAKKEQQDDGKGWIIWGWLLFTASIFSFLNLQLHWVNQYFFWNVLGFSTIVLTRFVFFKKRVPVKTYTADLFEKLNIGFFISIIFTVVAINIDVIRPTGGFAFIINIYGFWILIYGAALNFKPSIIAAFIVWGLGFATLFVKTFDWTMLLHAAAVLIGFIIPGHMANRAFKKTSA